MGHPVQETMLSPNGGKGIGYEYSKDRDWRVPRDPGTKSI